KLGDLARCPSEPVHEHHGDALLFGQVAQRSVECRLDPRNGRRRLLLAVARAPPSGSRLPDAIQVADRVRHPLHPAPMRPPPRPPHRPARRATPPARAVPGDEGTPETRLDIVHEGLEGLGFLAARPHSTSRPPNLSAAPHRAEEMSEASDPYQPGPIAGSCAR